MHPIMPILPLRSYEDDPPPRRRQRVDWEVRLRQWLAGLVAVSLVLAVRLPGPELAGYVAPTIVEWQSRIIDMTSGETPPLPPLPDSPFAR